MTADDVKQQLELPDVGQIGVVVEDLDRTIAFYESTFGLGPFETRELEAPNVPDRGEEKHIFPFQQNADVFFNSGLAYELSVLKLWAEPRLAAVDAEDPNYGRARSLVNMLTLVLPIDAREVPPTSLLREFIGESGFKY